MASFSNWVLSVKVVLFSTGVLSLAVALKFSVPLVSDFIVSDVPIIWSFFLTWLRPPYLYILVNFIIISIAASSKFLNHKLDEQAHLRDTLVVPPSYPAKMSDEKGLEYAVYDVANVAVSQEDMISSGDSRTDCTSFNGVISKSYVEDSKVQGMAPEVQQERISNAEMTRIRNEEIANEESVRALGSVTTSMQSRDSLVFSLLNDDEKSPVSARFGHRKAAKASPQGGKVALGVAKPKRQDTLESTWRTMTEGRAMPLTRHLKKSDTMNSHLRRNATPLRDQNGCTSPNSKLMRKSETFSEQSRALKENYSSASSSPGSTKMRKEPSLSQDELNRRVEAFIRKFNQEMRLQRQESLRQYREMMTNCGAG